MAQMLRTPWESNPNARRVLSRLVPFTSPGCGKSALPYTSTVVATGHGCPTLLAQRGLTALEGQLSSQLHPPPESQTSLRRDGNKRLLPTRIPFLKPPTVLGR